MKRWLLLVAGGLALCPLMSVLAQEQALEALPSQSQPLAQDVLEDGSIINDLDNNPPLTVAAEGVGAPLLNSGQADLRIGFINFRRIMASIPQLQSVSSTLDREFDQQKTALASKQQELTEMEQILANMNRGDAYSDYEKQVIAKRRDYVRDEAAYRDAYSVRRNEELAKLQRIVVDEIVAIAKESDYDVILNDTGVIYVSEEADLTSSVIERLRAIGE